MSLCNWFYVVSLLIATPASGAFVDSGQTNLEILRTDPAIVGWAAQVTDFQRGHQDYQDPGLGLADFGQATDMLGSAGSPVSLGDGGSITVTFGTSIADGPGPDLAVFENGFAFGVGVYMELGFVEVSSDGVNFARLPAISRVQGQIDSFDPIDPAQVYNLAGNYVGGTGIDLQDLVVAGHPLVQAGALDLSNVTHVRLVDVIGHAAAGGATQDFFGQAVSDPYPTAFGSSGMDLTGVAVLNPGGIVATEAASWGRVKSLFGR